MKVYSQTYSNKGLIKEVIGEAKAILEHIERVYGDKNNLLLELKMELRIEKRNEKRGLLYFKR